MRQSRPYFAVKWQKDRTDTGRLLDDLYKIATRKNTGGWVYNRMFSDLDVIHDWGRLPSEFGLCTADEDLNLMAAYTSTVSKMRAWEDYEHARKMKKQAKN